MLLTILEVLSYIWVLAVLGFTGFGYASYFVNMRRVNLLKKQQTLLIARLGEFLSPPEYTVVTKDIGFFDFWPKEKHYTIYTVIIDLLKTVDLNYAVTVQFPEHKIPAADIFNTLEMLRNLRANWTLGGNINCRYVITVTYHIPKDMLA